MQAAQRSVRLQRFLAAHPFCCYCGGATLAETIDHMPSTQMFDGEHRPKGLELPACDRCNQATKKAEQVAAFLARITPHRAPKVQFNEFRKLARKISKHHPMLYAELAPSWLQQDEARRTLPGFDGGPLNVGGPLLAECLTMFQTKLGLGLYYACTGKSLPQGGAIWAQRYTNWHRLTNNIPDEIFRGLSAPLTLEMGKFNVANQFQYQFGVADRLAAFVATFRKAFLVHLVVHEDAHVLRAALPPGESLTAPGFTVT